MTKREKTDFNLGNTNNSHGNWKSLGPNPSFPVGAANGATPFSLPVVGKPTASLLQLWTSRQKDKTRNCHAEFAGRSYGEVKAELYPQMRWAIVALQLSSHIEEVHIVVSQLCRSTLVHARTHTLTDTPHTRGHTLYQHHTGLRG